MNMGTLWEKLTKNRVEKPKKVKQQVAKLAEEKVHNPLNLKVNSTVSIKTIDLEDSVFTVKGIRAIDRNENGVSHPIVDYDVASEDLSNTIKKRIRLYPMKDGNSQFSNDVILFDLLAEFPYDENYFNQLASGEVAEPTLKADGTPEIDNDGQPVFDYFWRVNEVKSAWDAKTKYLADRNRDGEVDPSEIQYGNLTYWDFYRDTKDRDDNPVQEYYLVEMDGNGYFEIWRGVKIDPSRLSA